MTEIKKMTKITLVVYAIVNFLFGILLVFLNDLILAPLTGWTNPLSPRNIGGIFLLSAIFAVIILRKKEWEEIKLIYTFMFSFFIVTIPIELILLIVLGSTYSAAYFSQSIMDIIIMSILFILGVFSYIKQE
ncbi:MAG: hypothetical protein ACTSP9_04220 [Promethearchaeota archaeon]